MSEMRHEAARPKGNRSTDDAPMQQPMRGASRSQVRRNPSADQKKVRRAIQRKTADIDNAGDRHCETCGYTGAPVLGDGTTPNCRNCGSYSLLAAPTKRRSDVGSPGDYGRAASLSTTAIRTNCRNCGDDMLTGKGDDFPLCPACGGDTSWRSIEDAGIPSGQAHSSLSTQANPLWDDVRVNSDQKGTQSCGQCQGTGRDFFGHCNACKGSGSVRYTPGATQFTPADPKKPSGPGGYGRAAKKGDGEDGVTLDEAMDLLTDRSWKQPKDAEKPDDFGRAAAKTATVFDTTAEQLNPGDNVRTPTGQTMKVQRVRPHETSSKHVYVDTDGGTALVKRKDPFQIVPVNSTQQELPGYGRPGGNSNRMPFDPHGPGGSNAAPGPSAQCPVCGTKGSMAQRGDKYACSRCGYTEQFGGAGGYNFSDSPSVVRTFSTVNDPLKPAIARRAQQVLGSQEESQ